MLKCFFHIVNNIKEKEKGVKLGGYFLHYRLFCSPVSVCLLTSVALWSLSVVQDGYTGGKKTLQTATKEQAKLKDLPKSLQVFVLLMKEIEPEPRGSHCRITSWQAGTDSGLYSNTLVLANHHHPKTKKGSGEER